MENFSKKYRALFAEAMDAMKAAMAEKSNVKFGDYDHVVNFHQIDTCTDMPFDGIAIYDGELVWVDLDLNEDDRTANGVIESFDIESMEILPCEFLNIVDSYIGE